MGWLGWGALGPLGYFLLKARTRGEAVAGGLLCGFLAYLGLLYWIYPTLRAGGVGPAASALGLGLLALTLALEFAAVSAYGFLLRKMGLKAWPYFFALGWYALEFCKVALAHKAVWFPWFMLGYTQWEYTRLIQVCSVTGVYGLSAAVCFTGALAAAALAADIPWRARLLRLLPAPALLAGLLWYGSAELRRADSLGPGQTLRVALLQPSIDFYAKWDPGEKDAIKGRLSGLLAGAGGAALAVWPENALPCWIDEPDCEAWLKAAAGSSGAGASLVGSVSKGGGKRVSALLLDSSGTIKAAYDKRQLVPFGEYVPLRALLGSFIKPVAELGEFEPGASEQRLLPLGGFRLGAAICYESIFPYLFAGDARDGADLFVNITNDGWYLDTAAPHQHFIANIFRAVETRRAVARAANNGLSGVIDPWGRVLARTQLNEVTVLAADAPLSGADPLFPAYGHWLAWMALTALAAVLLALVLM